jgi:hypothetical protein
MTQLQLRRRNLEDRLHTLTVDPSCDGRVFRTRHGPRSPRSSHLTPGTGIHRLSLFLGATSSNRQR